METATERRVCNDKGKRYYTSPLTLILHLSLLLKTAKSTVGFKMVLAVDDLVLNSKFEQNTVKVAYTILSIILLPWYSILILFYFLSKCSRCSLSLFPAPMNICTRPKSWSDLPEEWHHLFGIYCEYIMPNVKASYFTLLYSKQQQQPAHSCKNGWNVRWLLLSVLIFPL